MLFAFHRMPLLGLLIFLSGLGFSHGASITPVAGRQRMPERMTSLVSKMTSLGRLSATRQIHLTFGLPLRNQPQLDDLLKQLYDPASPNYHKFITPQEFTTRFGPSQSDYDTLLEFVRTNGFRVTGTQPNRVLVDVTGSAATVERVFGVTLRTYRHPKENRDFYAPDTQPTLAAPVTVLNVSGLDDYSLPHPNLKLKNQPFASSITATPQAGSAPGGSYRGNDFRAAYVPGTALTGAGQSVALVQFDGYYSNDIATYISQAGISTSVVLTNIPVSGGVSSPGSGSVEVSLDIEMAIAMAPGLDKIYVYEGPNGATAWSTILGQIANDNLAQQISCSWGGGGADATSEQIFKQMAAQGQSFFNASGDSDAFTSSVTFPSDSTNITQVGGTTLTTASAGGPYSSEKVWNWGGGTGSSGGVSTYYAIPSWQTNISMALNGGSTSHRNIPDVALTGDNVYVVYSNGVAGVVGGTSCAAPLWAGYCALINQQASLVLKPSVGFLNPALYAMANTSAYTTNFHDITTGDNTSPSSPSQYYAVAGYDLCTGLGTPDGTNLINALVPLVYASAIIGDAWTLAGESATPANGAIDPGETVSVSFELMNQGNLATSDLVATLLPNSGVLSPDGPQSYGVLSALNGTASRTFSFTTSGTCGSNIQATLQLQDGTNDLGTVTFDLPLGRGSGLVQNFDAVTTPDLPAFWKSVNVAGTNAEWETTTAASDTSPNAAFMEESLFAGENTLVSPLIPIAGSSAQLTFRQNYSFEYVTSGSGKNKTTTYYDGGVLEIQIGNGAFTDIVAAGGSFVSGGYNGSITTSSDNPLGGSSAWVGSSSGWRTVTVNLPASAAGQNIRLRWNCATDGGNAGSGVSGWYVDSIALTDSGADCLSVYTDIAASQSLATNSLQSGQDLVYTLSVTNLGPQSAADVIVTDTVPVNATFVSASPGCSYGAGQVICSAGMLSVGGSTNFTVTLTPASGNVFTNLIGAGTVTPEVSLANNQTTLVSTQAVTSDPPQITLSPVAQTIECGGNASCSITTSGSLPLAIQWSLDSAIIPDATNSTLSLTNVHLPDHIVSVTVTNLYGSVTSNAVVNVLDTLAPTITLNGANPLYVELGGSFTDPGAVAMDVCSGVLPVTTNGSVDANVIGTNLLAYAADDGNGNTNSVTRAVIVRDTTAPTILWSFTNLVLVADTNCSALMPDVTGTNDIRATDLSEPLTITQSPTNGTALAEGTNSTLLTVVDAYGNTAYSTNSVVVKDETPPVITLNGANPLYAELGSVFADPGAVAMDTCAGVLPVSTNGAVNMNAIGTNTLTYTADDGSGNTNSVTRTVIVQDTTPPAIVWSFTNLVLAADTNCSALMPDVTGTNYLLATDLSGPLTIAQSPTNGTVLAKGTNLTLLTVVDAYGNTTYSTNTVVVKDETPPAITLNGANLVYVELGGAFADPGATASDLCSVIASLTTNGTVNTSAVSTNLLTYIAADGSGNTNSVTRTVIVQDTTAPAIVWSFTNLVLAAGTNCSALMPDVTGTNYIQATDLSEPLTIAQSPTNGTVLAEGTNSTLLTVVDAYGNTTYSTNTVVVRDETPPAIMPIGVNPLYVELGGAFADPGAVANDLCSGIALFTTNGIVNTSTVSTNVLTYLAVDDNGNTNSATRTVIVQDTTAPMIVWSFTNLVLAADTNCSALMPDVTGTNYLQATDLSEPLTIAQSPTNGTVLAEGTNQTVLTIVDAYGNTAYSTNWVVVKDETPPAITLNGANPLYVELGGAFADPGAVAMDTCAGIVPVSTDGSVNMNVIATNMLAYTADDGSGNTNFVVRTVIVEDTTAPTITWSFTNLVLAADTNCSALMPDVTGTNYVQATDLSGPLTITQSPTNGTTLAEGIHLTMLTVVDAYGNTTYSTNSVMVKDETPPVITLNGANPLYIELGSTFSDPGAYANDICTGAVSVTVSGVVDTNAVGTNTLTYVADDGSGNTNFTTRVVIVRDTTAPIITWSFTNLVLAADNSCSALMPDVTGTNYIRATDLSKPLTIAQSPTNGTVLAEGTNSTLLTVVDAYGNTTYSTNWVVVKDKTPPAITLTGANPLYVELGGSFADPGVVVSDLCSDIALLATNGTVNTSAISTNLLTYVAVDSNGNTNSATRTVIIHDTTAPTIVWSFTNLVLAADTNCSALMPDVTGTNFIQASDLSGPLTIVQDPTNMATLMLGSNEVIIAVLDDFGNASYSTNVIVVQDQSPPVIVLQPQSQTNSFGSNATFSVAATACTPVSYQWYFNSQMVAGGTNDLLTLTNLQSTNVGDYFAVATADGGSVTSVVVSLDVMLTNGVVGSSNGVTLILTGAPNSTYILETTTNLNSANWLPYDTNTLGTNGVWEFTDPQAAEFQQRFFRLKLK